MKIHVRIMYRTPDGDYRRKIFALSFNDLARPLALISEYMLTALRPGALLVGVESGWSR
ncbi:MAG TPA: hypothetical protein VLJ37_05305 [bacterium]|nr:hypothetical protein [bacterium]